MEETIQPLNYSVHAIEGLTELARHTAATLPKGAAALRKTGALLQRAVKFLLPNCADLVDVRKLTDNHLDMLRLPYPLVVLEVPWKPETGRFIEEGLLKESRSSKRIVLAWDESFAVDPAALTRDIGEPGIYVVSLYFDDNVQRWLCATLGAFIPRQNTVVKYSDTGPDVPEQAVNRLQIAQGWATPNSPTHIIEYFVTQPEMYRELESRMGPEVAATRLRLDLQDELLSLWQFCLTVNCSNIQAVDVPPAAALNKKRVKAGKQPFFTYKVLQLPVSTPSAKGPGFQLEGQRSSPRMHLRRGHPRRLRTGKMTYVRAAVIGSASDGVVEKTYLVRP